MHSFSLIEGEGVAGPFNEVEAVTTTMYSCYAFVFENQQSKRAGMYHYPAGSLHEPLVQGTVLQMINDVQPQILHVVPGGIFAEAEIAGRVGDRKQDIHPLYRGKSQPTKTGVTGADDPGRIGSLKSRNPGLLDMTARPAKKDYDDVKRFLDKQKGRCILKIYPAGLIAWYNAAKGGVEVNHTSSSVSGKRTGIDDFFSQPQPTGRQVRLGMGNIMYYGGSV